MRKVNATGCAGRYGPQNRIVMRIGCLLLIMSCLAACRHEPDHLDLAHLTRRSDPLVGYIGRVNTNVLESQTGTVAVPSGPVHVDGWAVDTLNHGPGIAMYMNVNGQPVSCEYGIPRLDVSTALKDTRYINSGYQCSIPQSNLRNGSNSIEPMLVDGDKSYSVGPTLHLQVGPQ
jgi:hypothetical protein